MFVKKKDCLVYLTYNTTGIQPYNLEQNVAEKFTKFSKIGFSDCFTAIFCDFLPKNVKIWLLGGRLGTLHQMQAFQRFS